MIKPSLITFCFVPKDPQEVNNRILSHIHLDQHLLSCFNIPKHNFVLSVNVEPHPHC